MRIIADVAGNPERCARAVHVAGSKGKGSVTAFVSAILDAGGLRPARYMSPHVTEYRERITLGDNFFSEEIYTKAGDRLRSVEEIISNKNSSRYLEMVSVSDGGSPLPTFFELLTLYFYLCAEEARCGALAVETGMGGRLDPTNISQSRAVVITGIELEHTDMLGDTVKKIAFEKAGIIKTGVPVLLAEQMHADYRDALDVFKKTAKDKNAPLFYLPDYARLHSIKITEEGTAFILDPATKDFFDAPFPVSIALPGEAQAGNAAIALFAIRAAFPELPVEPMLDAIKNTRLPARFERVLNNPAVIVDGAHTAMSIKLCKETWTRLYGTRGILIFGCAQGKNVYAMAEELLDAFSKIIITTPGTYKISEPEKVYEVFLEVAASRNAETEAVNKEKIVFLHDTQTGINAALEEARERNLPVLGTGSFYLAAEIRNSILSHKWL